MDKLIDILKSSVPALATAALGPAGGAVVSAIAAKLGVAPNADAVVSALESNPELMVKLREIDVRAFEAEQKAVTERWQADMGSDSWMSKNIRPLTLVAILLGYFVFAGLSAAGIEVKQAYVTLLGDWGQLIMLAYFGGRTAEKIASTVRGSK